MENELNELYFKDAFDLSNEGINLTVNKVSTNCITSNNDNFNLDSEGNLTVKSLNTSNLVIDYLSLLDKVYPIGCVYISVANVDPSTLFGGTWVAFAQGKTLIGVDLNDTDFNTVEKTGGSKDLQSHNHIGSTSTNGEHRHILKWRSYGITTNSSGAYILRRDDPADAFDGTNSAAQTAGNHSHSFTTNNTGNGNSGNLQPFITCYFFKRTA